MDGLKMDTTFNKLELDLATEVINIGLAKAADSLSFFTQEKVLIRCNDLVISEFYEKELFSKSAVPLTIVSTKIRGGMTGYCYLIFNQEEVEQLYQLSLPESAPNDPVQLEEMGKEILKEIDNIITAAVVTQFSNLLKVEMHGYVPELFSGSKEDVDSYIRNHAKNEKMILHFNTPLYSGEQNVSPEFLWCLDETFVEAVKKFVEYDESLVNFRKLI